MTIGVSKKADVDKMVFRPHDPPVYGHICPHCQKRYGDPGAEINLTRCDTCPKFSDQPINWWGKKKKRMLKQQQLLKDNN